MDKLATYLEFVPLPVLLAVTGGMGLIYLIMPPDTRFHVTFMMMPAWLVASRSPDLGAGAAFTKITSPLLFVLIAVAAVLRPGARREIPSIVWLYPVMGTYLLFCLIGVEHAGDNLIIQVQWITLTLAAMATVATLTTLEDLEKFIDVLTIGCIGGLMVPGAAVLLHPGEVFGTVGRFAPWGASPNLIGIIFLLGTSLLIYKAVTTNSHNLRLLLVGIAVTSIGMALITGSRQVVFSMAIVLGLMFFPMLKRPSVVLLALLSGFFIIPAFFAMNPDAVNRLLSLDSSGRVGVWGQYFLVSLGRPLGLLGTSGLDAHMDWDIGGHPHNVYVEALYVGGYPYLFALVFLVFTGLKATYRVWRARFVFGSAQKRFFVHAMAAMVLAMYIQGIGNQVIFHPTYTWSFLCVILTIWFIAMERQLPALYSVYLDELEYGYDEEEQLIDEYGHVAPA